MDRDRPVPKLSGSNRQMVSTVRQKIDSGLGTMLGRRRAIEHTDRDPLPLQPFAPPRFGFAAPARQGVFRLIQTFLKTVAADHDVAWSTPDTQNGIARTDHVLAAKVDWIHLHFPRQFVHCALD